MSSEEFGSGYRDLERVGKERKFMIEGMMRNRR